MNDWWGRGKEPILQNEAEIDVADLADDSVETAKIKDANVTQPKIDPSSLDGTVVGPVADANVLGGIPVLHRITASALTGDVDVTLTHKTRVIDVWAVQAGGAGGVGDTIIVKNGTGVISDTLDLNIADKVIVRATTIDDAQNEIAAAGTLRVTGASGVTAEVYVLGILVA